MQHIYDPLLERFKKNIQSESFSKFDSYFQKVSKETSNLDSFDFILLKTLLEHSYNEFEWGRFGELLDSKNLDDGFDTEYSVNIDLGILASSIFTEPEYFEYELIIDRLLKLYWIKNKVKISETNEMVPISCQLMPYFSRTISHKNVILNLTIGKQYFDNLLKLKDKEGEYEN